MKIEIDKRWESSLKNFKSEVSDINYRTWFELIQFDRFENRVIHLVVPTKFYYDWLMEHYFVLFKKVVTKNFGANVRVLVQTIIPTDYVYEDIVSKPSEVKIITNIHDELIADLKKEPTLIHSISAFEFEDIVAVLLKKRGYDVHQTPRSGDGGKDIIAKFSSPTGDNCVCYVECKKYDPLNPVGVEYIRSLYGVIETDKVNLGMLVTTSRFTKGAIEFGKLHENRLKLKDFADLKEWFKA